MENIYLSDQILTLEYEISAVLLSDKNLSALKKFTKFSQALQIVEKETILWNKNAWQLHGVQCW